MEKKSTGRSLSQILTFLELFDNSPFPKLNLLSLNNLETLFILKSWPLVRTNLDDLGLDPEIITQSSQIFVQLRIKSAQESSILDIAKKAELIETLEKTLNNVKIFDYPKIVTQVIAASKWVIEKECPKFKGRLQKIHPISIIPEKPEYQLAQFEISFSGGGDTIIFPDPSKYHDEHFKIWNQMAPKPNRIFRDYEYRSYCSPLHEIIHCLQTLEHQKDATSWKSEHDASRAEMEILGAISKNLDKIMKDTPDQSFDMLQDLDKGLLEEVMYYALSLVRKHLHPKTTNSEALKMYESWRDSFGAIDPGNGKDAWGQFMESPEIVRTMKNRLSLEGFANGDNIGKLLAIYFDQGEYNLAITNEIEVIEKVDKTIEFWQKNFNLH